MCDNEKQVEDDFEDGEFRAVENRRAHERWWMFTCPVCGIAHREREDSVQCCLDAWGVEPGEYMDEDLRENEPEG